MTGPVKPERFHPSRSRLRNAPSVVPGSPQPRLADLGENLSPNCAAAAFRIATCSSTAASRRSLREFPSEMPSRCRHKSSQSIRTAKGRFHGYTFREEK